MRILKIATQKEAQTGSFGEANNEFVNQVVPEISLSTELMDKNIWVDITKVWPCEIKYRIDLDFAQWGVAGATLSLHEEPIIVRIDTVTEVGPDGASKTTEETKTLTIDPSKIRVELKPGVSISLYALDLRLNPDFTVDYADSYITGSTLMGEAE